MMQRRFCYSFTATDEIQLNWEEKPERKIALMFHSLPFFLKMSFFSDYNIKQCQNNRCAPWRNIDKKSLGHLRFKINL